MKIEVTSVSVSKKGTVWIQAKALGASEELAVGHVFDCTYDPEATRAAAFEKKPESVKAGVTDER